MSELRRCPKCGEGGGFYARRERMAEALYVTEGTDHLTKPWDSLHGADKASYRVHAGRMLKAMGGASGGGMDSGDGVYEDEGGALRCSVGGCRLEEDSVGGGWSGGAA